MGTWPTKKYDVSIPEDKQNSLQQRLRNLREAQGLIRTRTPFASQQCLQKWEDTDISGMKISDFYAIAEYMSWTLEETLAYFAASDESPMPMRKSDKRIAVLLRNMPESFQNAACDIVERLLGLSDENGMSPAIGGFNFTDEVVEHSREPDVVIDLTKEVVTVEAGTGDQAHRFSTQTFRDLFGETT